MATLIYIVLFLGALHLDKAKDARGVDISGDGIVATAGREIASPLVVEVTDDEGLPCEGVPVSLKLISAPFGAEKGAVFTDTTDARGYAVFRFQSGNLKGEYQLEATSRLSEESVQLSYIATEPYFIFFVLIGLLGGFVLFMYGLNFGSKALTRIAGGKLREFLWRFTKIPVIGVFVGIFITFLTQSSSATTVMLVSFTEAELMKFFQTLGVILGADIGTTITVQLIAFKIFDIALLIVACGFFMMIFGKGKGVHYTGRVIFSFGLIFFGMKIMTDAIHPLTLIPSVTQGLISTGNNPLLLLIISAMFTGIIQSSGATMAIIVSFAFEGLLNLEIAIPLILGANIGTCVTAFLASVGRSTEAKRVALAHIMFKVIMAAVFFPFIRQFACLVAKTSLSIPRQVANAHTLFNLFGAILFLPLLLPYSKLIQKMLPKRKIGFEPRYLDPNLVSSPSIAIGQALRETLRMADIVQSMFTRSINVFRTNEEMERIRIIEEDNKVDTLEEDITRYLVKISEEEVSSETSVKSASLLHIVDEIEHIGDVISKSLMTYAKKKIKGGFVFSKEGFKDIEELAEFSNKTLTMAINALTTLDMKMAREVAERREEGRNLLTKYNDAHLERLRRGLKESIETSTVHLDLISDLERMNFHASNIGVHILELK